VKLVLCNIGPEDADRVARVLVDERRCACVNLLPVRSVYRWEGAVQTESEVTMLIKVAADGVDALRARIQELHPYELPEILVLDVDLAGSLGAYVQWVRDETG